MKLYDGIKVEVIKLQPGQKYSNPTYEEIKANAEAKMKRRMSDHCPHIRMRLDKPLEKIQSPTCRIFDPRK